MKNSRYYGEKLGLELTDKQCEMLDIYMDMVIEKNKVMNLTAITTEEDFVLKHFADSLSVAYAVPELKKKFEAGCTLADIGTGAGFPGLVLKIAFPEVKLTLIDALNKRVRFLDEVIERLGLDGVTTIHSRAEDGARKNELRDTFDVVVSRAVAALPVLVEYCLPYAKVGGQLVSYKSGEIAEELRSADRAIKLVGGKLNGVPEMMLPDSDISRSFVVIDKVKATPKAYPRKAGVIKKEPL